MQQNPTKNTQGFKWFHKAGMLLLPFFIGFLFHGLTSLASSSASLQFLGFPFLFLCYYLLHHQLKTNGYDQMAIDFKSWTSYTLYIYIGLLLLGALVLLIAMWLR
jgi:amino acid permease